MYSRFVTCHVVIKEVSISPEFGSPTLIFKLQESFFSYQTMPFALKEPKNDAKV